MCRWQQLEDDLSSPELSSSIVSRLSSAQHQHELALEVDRLWNGGQGALVLRKEHALHVLHTGTEPTAALRVLWEVSRIDPTAFAGFCRSLLPQTSHVGAKRELLQYILHRPGLPPQSVATFTVQYTSLGILERLDTEMRERCRHLLDQPARILKQLLMAGDTATVHALPPRIRGLVGHALIRTLSAKALGLVEAEPDGSGVEDVPSVHRFANAPCISLATELLDLEMSPTSVCTVVFALCDRLTQRRGPPRDRVFHMMRQLLRYTERRLCRADESGAQRCIAQCRLFRQCLPLLQELHTLANNLERPSGAPHNLRVKMTCFADTEKVHAQNRSFTVLFMPKPYCVCTRGTLTSNHASPLH